MGVTHTCPPPRAPRPAPLSHAPGPVCDAAGAGMASVLSKASHAARASGGGGGRGEGGCRAPCGRRRPRTGFGLAPRAARPPRPRAPRSRRTCKPPRSTGAAVQTRCAAAGNFTNTSNFTNNTSRLQLGARHRGEGGAGGAWSGRRPRAHHEQVAVRGGALEAAGRESGAHLYGVRDAACPLSTRGGTRLVRLVRGKGRGGGARERRAREGGRAQQTTRRLGGCRRAWTRRVQSVRGEGRGVST